MTTVSDTSVVERLRNLASLVRRGQIMQPRAASKTIDDSAETIERLTRERDGALQYATSFLVSYVNKYCDPVPAWKPLPDLIGVLTQLDNASTVTDEMLDRALAAEAQRDGAYEECARIADGLATAAMNFATQAHTEGAEDTAHQAAGRAENYVEIASAIRAAAKQKDGG